MSPYLWTLPFTTMSPGTCFVLDDGSGESTSAATSSPSTVPPASGTAADLDLAGARPRGKAVGYVIGCPSTRALTAPEQYDRQYVLPILQADQGREDVPDPGREGLVTREGWFVAGTERQPGVPDSADVNPRALAQLAYRGDWLVLGPDKVRDTVATKWKGTMHIDLLKPWQRVGWGPRMIEVFVDELKGRREKARQADDQDDDCGEGFFIGIAAENERVIKFYEKCGFRLLKDIGEGIFMVKDV
jgi:GNAT superfamily N-acetyltransferase